MEKIRMRYYSQNVPLPSEFLPNSRMVHETQAQEEIQVKLMIRLMIQKQRTGKTENGRISISLWSVS
jgi:hypothetical protein